LPEDLRHQIVDVESATWEARIDAAIHGVGLNLLFQPIIDLQRCTVAGYETLARFDSDVAATPDRWFAAAARLGRGPELETAVLQRALAVRTSLPRNTFLTINIEPESLTSSSVMSLLLAHSLSGIAIEVTEHRELGDPGHVAHALQQLRAAGALIAVDDAGSGYAGLQQILTMRPHILKVDRALIEGIDTDEAKAALVEMLGVFANRIDAWVLAEGIETMEEGRRCLALRVPLAQGYYFGRPAPPWSDIELAARIGLGDLIGRDTRADLRSLFTVTPSMTEDAAFTDPSVFADETRSFLVVIGRDDRPTGVLTPESMFSRQLLCALTANLDTTPDDLAQRLATGDFDLNLPVIVTDNAGRYVGTVATPRLIAHLASR
jgi:EAL domain-containing protein (putative c-di-GMP-specific phosphodiesterase class I)